MHDPPQRSPRVMTDPSSSVSKDSTSTSTAYAPTCDRHAKEKNTLTRAAAKGKVTYLTSQCNGISVEGIRRHGLCDPSLECIQPHPKNIQQRHIACLIGTNHDLGGHRRLQDRQSGPFTLFSIPIRRPILDFPTAHSPNVTHRLSGRRGRRMRISRRAM
jgi:hypothetical protein